MAERVFLGSPIPSAGGRVLVSPFQFLVDGNDNLRIEGWNTVASCQLTVSWRFAELDGIIRPYERTVTLTADRTKTTLNVPLGVGYLVNLAVYATAAAPRIGQTFVSIKLIRGLTAATMVLGWLVQGYVTAEQGLGWPGSPIGDSISGGGVQRAIAGTNPAAGAEFSETVPTGARWDLLYLNVELDTSSQAATREARLAFTQSSLTMAIVNTAGSQAASLNRVYTWGQALPVNAGIIGTIFQGAIPSPSILLAGDRFRSTTNGLQTLDDWRTPIYVVREWLEVDA